jgi:hypothetical protein
VQRGADHQHKAAVVAAVHVAADAVVGVVVGVAVDAVADVAAVDAADVGVADVDVGKHTGTVRRVEVPSWEADLILDKLEG